MKYTIKEMIKYCKESYDILRIPERCDAQPEEHQNNPPMIGYEAEIYWAIEEKLKAAEHFHKATVAYLNSHDCRMTLYYNIKDAYGSDSEEMAALNKLDEEWVKAEKEYSKDRVYHI